MRDFLEMFGEMFGGFGVIAWWLLGVGVVFYYFLKGMLGVLCPAVEMEAYYEI